MQFWAWMLVMSLAVAVVRARPEGGPVAPLTVSESKPEEVAVVVIEDEAGLKPEIVVTDEAKEEVAEVAVKEKEQNQQSLPVPIEPDVMAPDDSKVFPEGSLRSPTPAAVEETIQGAVPVGEKEEKRRARMTRASYLPAEARGAESEGIELNLSPGTVLVPYYGGAKGQYLILAKPVTAAELAKKKKKGNKKPTKPGHKEEEEEEEENVGEENEEPSKPPPSDSSDTVTIAQPPPNASMAEAKPVGIAVAGEGGVASSRPSATALVGPGGLAIARPIATAIAGIQGAEFVIAAAGQPQMGPTTLLYPIGGPVPVGSHVYSVQQHGLQGLQGLQPVQHPHHLNALPDPWLAYPPPPPLYPYYF